MKKLFASVTAVFAVLLSVDASAVSYIDPVQLSTGLTNLQDTVGAVAANAWTLAFLVTGISVAIGLFKKFTHKGAS